MVFMTITTTDVSKMISKKSTILGTARFNFFLKLSSGAPLVEIYFTKIKVIKNLQSCHSQETSHKPRFCYCEVILHFWKIIFNDSKSPLNYLSFDM